MNTYHCNEATALRRYNSLIQCHTGGLNVQRNTRRPQQGRHLSPFHHHRAHRRQRRLICGCVRGSGAALGGMQGIHAVRGGRALGRVHAAVAGGAVVNIVCAAEGGRVRRRGFAAAAAAVVGGVEVRETAARTGDVGIAVQNIVNNRKKNITLVKIYMEHFEGIYNADEDEQKQNIL